MSEHHFSRIFSHGNKLNHPKLAWDIPMAMGLPHGFTPYLHGGAPQGISWFINTSNYNYSYLRTINHSYWSYVNPNLAIERGHHFVSVGKTTRG